MMHSLAISRSHRANAISLCTMIVGKRGIRLIRRANFFVFAVGFSGVCATSVSAQVGEPRHALSVGFGAGVAMNSVGFDPTIKQGQHVGPTLGIAFRATSEKYFKSLCALQIELNYTRLGWKEDIYDSKDQPLPDTYQRHINYLQLPAFARLGWGREQHGLMGYFMAGPQIGYCFGEATKQSVTWTTDASGNPDRPNGMFAQYSMPIEHKFDYGITAGVGLEFNTGVGHFMLDGRYYYGLADLYGNSKKDVFSRSNNSTIIVKFTYLFDFRK